MLREDRSRHWSPSCFTTPCSTQCSSRFTTNRALPSVWWYISVTSSAVTAPSSHAAIYASDLRGAEQFQHQFVAEPPPPQLLEHPA
jgi:hypothetical protein